MASTEIGTGLELNTESPPAAVPLSPPAAGETVQMTVQPGEAINLAFNPGDADVSREGDALVLSFENGGLLRLDGFTADASSLLILPDGTAVTGEQVIALLDNDTGEIPLETAAGDTSDAGPESGDANFGIYYDNLGEANFQGLTALGTLGETALGASSPPSSIDPTQITGLSAQGAAPAPGAESFSAGALSGLVSGLDDENDFTGDAEIGRAHV